MERFGAALHHLLANLGARLLHLGKQRLSLLAELQAAAAAVLGVGHALDPAVFLHFREHARHQRLVGAQVVGQLLVRAQRLVADEQQAAHGVAVEPVVVPVHLGAHATPVDEDQIVQGIQHLRGHGGCIHGVGFVLFVDKVNMMRVSFRHLVD